MESLSQVLDGFVPYFVTSTCTYDTLPACLTIGHFVLSCMYIVDPLLLEIAVSELEEKVLQQRQKLEEQEEKLQKQESRIEKQEALLEKALERIEELELRIRSFGPTEHESCSYTYSPPPLPAPLATSSFPIPDGPPCTSTTLTPTPTTSQSISTGTHSVQGFTTPHRPFSTQTVTQPLSQPAISHLASSQPPSPSEQLSLSRSPSTSVQCLPIAPRKNSVVLPASAIDRTKLVAAAQTLLRYPKLGIESKASILAVKLARESFFGESAMAQCTVMGCGKYPALPPNELNSLKQVMFARFPKYWPNPVLFESVWKDCMEAIGQACKRIRAENEKKTQTTHPLNF